MVDYVKYESPIGPRIYRFGKYSISQIEIKHLSIAFVMLGLTLFMRNVRISGLFNGGISALLSNPAFVTEFSAFILAFALGFILHEFAHKLVAQYYGFVSEFRADFFMLIIMLFLALISPVIFLAPGAVIILARRLSIKQNGIISVAGPVVNLILALIGLFIVFVFAPQGFLGRFATNLIWINALLGVFNMIPFWILDGKKVLAWSKPIYFSVMGVLLLLFFFF